MPEYVEIWWAAILGLWRWMGIIGAPVAVGVFTYRYLLNRGRRT